MSKHTIYLDPSALKKTACTRQYWLACQEGMIPKGSQDKASTFFGTCLHNYAEVWANTGEPDASISTVKMWNEKAEKLSYTTGRSSNEYLVAGKLVESMLIVREFLEADKEMEILPDPNGQNGKKMTEYKFAIPLFSDENVNVIVCGTIDKLCRQKRGLYMVGDYKFSRKWGDPYAFLRAYKLDPQPRTYLWAVRWYARQFPNSIFAAMVNHGPLGFFIDGGFHSKNDPIQMQRSDVMIESDEEIEEFDHMLMQAASNLVANYYFYKDKMPARDGIVKGICKTIYGDCEYAPICKQNSHTGQLAVLNQKYEHRAWEPLTAW